LRRYHLSSKPGSYVKRLSRSGQFKKWTKVGKSLRADRAHKAKYHPKKPGHGFEGDYKK